MAVRIGKIDLVGLSRVATEDTRSLVKQRGPGQAGGLFQDLGREPVTIVMEGILLGEDTQAALEELRQAHAKAKPMTFATDAIAGADLTHVLIANLQIRQLAGHTSRFAFFLRVREYTEPPEAVGTGAAKVDAAAKADAAAWQQGAVDAAAVKQTPGALMNAIDNNPALVAHLDGNELGALAGANADKLSGQDFGKLLGTVGQQNPSAVLGMVDSLKKQGRFGDLVAKLMASGANLLAYLKTIKLSAVLALFKMIAGFGEFLKRLKAVGEKARSVGDMLGALPLSAPFDELTTQWNKPPPAGELDLYTEAQKYKAADHPAVWVWETKTGKFEPLVQVDESSKPAATSQVADLIGAIADLITAIDDLMQTDTFKGLVDLVKELHLEKVVVPLLQLICTVLTTAIGWLGTLKRIAALPRIVAPLMLHLEELERLTDLAPAGRTDELTNVGWGDLVEPCNLANVVISQFTRLGRISSTLTGKGQVEQRIGQLQSDMSGLHKTFDGYRKQLDSSANTASTTNTLPTPDPASLNSPPLLAGVSS